MIERRLGFLYFMVCGALLCIGARLFQLQVLGMTAEDPDAVLRKPLPLEEVAAPRGRILDREGEILAADEPARELGVQYREILLMYALQGNDLSGPELNRIRKPLSDVILARLPQGEDAAAARKRLQQRPADWGDPSYASLMAEALQARLDILSRATGADPASILAQIQATVRRVRYLRQAVPGPRELYEETIPHVLIHNVPIEAIERVEADVLDFPGAVVQEDYRRAYPQGSVAAHAVGYLRRAQAPQRGEVPEDPAVRPGDWIGVTGAEKQFDSLLRGVPGILSTEPDAQGCLRRKVLFPAQPGRDVYLSLSGPAQRRAEAELAGKVGAAVVMDIRSGELLVLASSPSFDPAIGPAGADLSRAIQDSVTPGSVFKPAVAFAAVAAGIDPKKWTVTCNGDVEIGGRRYHCEGHHGVVNMEAAIAQSCNIYFYEAAREVARRAGTEEILRWASALNLGRRTGVDLPYEWAGRLPALHARAGAEAVNLGVGQGDLSVTPIQVAAMMCAIATGGKIPRPTIVHRVEPPLESSLQEAPSEVALPADGLRAVRAGMWDCTVLGTARGVGGLRELKAAVKTGTAQTRDLNINQNWIAGYLPYDAPRWVFAVVVHNSTGHGATVAGPIAVAALQAVVNPRADKLTARGGAQ